MCTHVQSYMNALLKLYVYNVKVFCFKKIDRLINTFIILQEEDIFLINKFPFTVIADLRLVFFLPELSNLSCHMYLNELRSKNQT